MLIYILAINLFTIFLSLAYLTKNNIPIQDYLKKPITIPPWHNYTGPSRKGDYTLPVITWLDSLAFTHDQEVKSQTIINTFSNTKEQSIGNILADSKFIGKYLLGVLSLGIYPLIKNYKLMQGNKFKKATYSFINTLIDINAGAIGVILFLINIVLNLINWRRK